ncbi:MAG: hypothetical protein ABMA25_12475 [Ilumatobacteraceae bacterium]
MLRWLERHAVTQGDGRRIVWHGSAEIARETGKSPGTLTQQIGQLRLSGHVLHSRRGHIELSPTIDQLGLSRSPEPGPATVITTLVDLANEYPAHREGIAAAIAIISRQPRTDSRDLRDNELSRGVSVQESEEEDLLPSSTDPTANTAPRNREAPFAVRSILEPLVALEQLSNPRAQITAGVARELSQLVTAEQLRTAVERVLPMVQRAEIKTGIGVIVSAARSGNTELFQPTSVPAAPAPTQLALDSPEPEADSPDPDVEDFKQLPHHVAQRFRDQALREASAGFRAVLAEHPDALTGAATEIWTRTNANVSTNVSNNVSVDMVGRPCS